MHPILFAALHGLVKGYALKSAPLKDPLHSVVVAPLREEYAYRAPLANAAASGSDDLLSATAFGLAHFDPAEPPGHRAMRVLDAGLGGLVYTRAMRSGGLADSIFAHAIHNAMVGIGGTVARKRAAVRPIKLKIGSKK